MLQKIKCILGFHKEEVVGWGNRFGKGERLRCRYCKRKISIPFIKDMTKDINDSDGIGR